MNRLRADFILLLVAFIWGSAFVVQRIAASYFDAFTFNGLRFLLGGLILLPFSRLRGAVRASRVDKRGIFDRRSLLFMLLGGIFLFAAAGLQQMGLETTTAGNAGFITTLYVVLVPILLLIFWRERIHWLSWLGAGIALLGSLLLSTAGSFHLAIGDLLVMVSAIFWALHVILVSRAVRHMDAFTFSAGQYLFAGIFNFIASVVFGISLAGLANGWWTVVYIGLLSTAVGYTLQVIGQKYAPPTDTTILLSMEAVFAATIGYLVLRETLQPVQLLGCGLVLLAVLMTQYKSIKFNAAESI